MNFDQSFTRLLGSEGGFVDDPRDGGGATCWGITENVARVNGYTGAMRDLPQDVAKEIYKSRYWNAIKADQLPDSLRFDVFDAAVNSGVWLAVTWLQTSVGALADGAIGPVTLAAANQAGPMVAARFNGARLNAMTSMGGWPSFSRGWSRRVAANLMQMGK